MLLIYMYFLSNYQLENMLTSLNNEVHFSVSSILHVVCLISFIGSGSIISSTKECVMLTPGQGISHTKKTTTDSSVDCRYFRPWRNYSKRYTSPLLTWSHLKIIQILFSISSYVYSCFCIFCVHSAIHLCYIHVIVRRIYIFCAIHSSFAVFSPTIGE